MGVQSGSASSKTGGNRRSSSEMKEEGGSSWSSLLEFEDSEERRGQEGYAQEGDCGREPLLEGMSMGAVV